MPLPHPDPPSAWLFLHRDTPESHRVLSLGASPHGVSPDLIATLVQRLCPQRPLPHNGPMDRPRHVVVAPLDRYGVLASGAALGGADFVGLCPQANGEGLHNFQASCLYTSQFLMVRREIEFRR